MRKLYLALAVGLFPSVALAQGISCEEVVAHLQTKYGEKEIAYGADHLGSVMRLFANPRDGSWTIIRMFPGGGCVPTVTGDGFQAGPMVPEGKPS